MTENNSVSKLTRNHVESLEIGKLSHFIAQNNIISLIIKFN